FYTGIRTVLGQLKSADHLTESQRHAVLAQVVVKRLDNLGIDKRQKAARTVDQSNADAQRRKDAGVFASHHTRADHRQSARQFLQTQDVVADENVLAVEGNFGIARGFGAGGDEHMGRGHGAVAGTLHHAQAQHVGVHEGRFRRDHFHAVALQLVARDVDFVADDVFGAEKEVIDGDVLLDGV